MLMFVILTNKRCVACPKLRSISQHACMAYAPLPDIQGGPAKVRPTYIFDVTFECIGKINKFSYM